MDSGRPFEQRRLPARLEPPEDHSPYRSPGIDGRVSARDEVTELGGGYEKIASRMFEQDRPYVLFRQTEDRLIVTGHMCHNQVRVGSRNRNVMATLNHNDSVFAQGGAESG